MKTALIDLFTSKKFIVATTAIAVWVGGHFGFAIDTTVLDRIFAALLVYVGAQGAADIGKSAAQVNARPVELRDMASPSSSSSTSTALSSAAALLLASILVGTSGVALASCATSKGTELAAIPGAVKDAVIACGGEAEAPAKSLLIELGTEAIKQVLEVGKIDWPVLEDQAWAQGIVTGGCAYTAFTKSLSAATAGASTTVERTLVAVQDPALASLERFRARAGGPRWSTEAAQ